MKTNPFNDIAWELDRLAGSSILDDKSRKAAETASYLLRELNIAGEHGGIADERLRVAYQAVREA